ncbi:hypothetical protein QL285_044702 [Trifolium repens]|nr:hypothetical protein QL285_044702 [Trifolium repens]
MMMIMSANARKDSYGRFPMCRCTIIVLIIWGNMLYSFGLSYPQKGRPMIQDKVLYKGVLNPKVREVSRCVKNKEENQVHSWCAAAAC